MGGHESAFGVVGARVGEGGSRLGPVRGRSRLVLGVESGATPTTWMVEYKDTLARDKARGGSVQ